jgi:hypothetical protein
MGHPHRAVCRLPRNAYRAEWYNGLDQYDQEELDRCEDEVYATFLTLNCKFPLFLSDFYFHGLMLSCRAAEANQQAESSLTLHLKHAALHPIMLSCQYFISILHL